MLVNSFNSTCIINNAANQKQGWPLSPFFNAAPEILTYAIE